MGSGPPSRGRTAPRLSLICLLVSGGSVGPVAGMAAACGAGQLRCDRHRDAGSWPRELWPVLEKKIASSTGSKQVPILRVAQEVVDLVALVRGAREFGLDSVPSAVRLKRWEPGYSGIVQILDTAGRRLGEAYAELYTEHDHGRWSWAGVLIGTRATNNDLPIFGHGPILIRTEQGLQSQALLNARATSDDAWQAVGDRE